LIVVRLIDVVNGGCRIDTDSDTDPDPDIRVDRREREGESGARG